MHPWPLKKIDRCAAYPAIVVGVDGTRDVALCVLQQPARICQGQLWSKHCQKLLLCFGAGMCIITPLCNSLLMLRWQTILLPLLLRRLFTATLALWPSLPLMPLLLTTIPITTQPSLLRYWSCSLALMPCIKRRIPSLKLVHYWRCFLSLL